MQGKMTGTVFTCGPFMSASAHMEQFTQDLYYSFLLATTLTDFIECENKLQQAIDDGEDADYIINLQNQSRQNNGLIELTLAVANPHDSDSEDA